MVRRVVGIVCVVAATLLAACDSQEEREAKKCESWIGAYVTSQGFVKQRLISPSKAEFPNATKISARYLGDCRHRIEAHVDGQNAYGGTLRKPYTAVVRYEGDDSWEIYTLILGDQVLVDRQLPPTSYIYDDAKGGAVPTFD